MLLNSGAANGLESILYGSGRGSADSDRRNNNYMGWLISKQ